MDTNDESAAAAAADNDPAFFNLNIAMSSSQKQRQAFTIGTSASLSPRLEDIGVAVEDKSSYKLSQVTNPRSSFDQKMIEEQAEEERERKKMIEEMITKQKQYESSSSFFVDAAIEPDDDDVDALLDAVVITSSTKMTESLAVPASSTIDVEPQPSAVIASTAADKNNTQPQTVNADAGVVIEIETETATPHVFNDEFHVTEDDNAAVAVITSPSSPFIDKNNAAVIAMASPVIDDMSSSFIMSPEGKELLIAASTLQKELNDQNDTQLTERDMSHASDSHRVVHTSRSRRLTDDTNLSSSGNGIRRLSGGTYSTPTPSIPSDNLAISSDLIIMIDWVYTAAIDKRMQPLY